jgi:hypothetical protein
MMSRATSCESWKTLVRLTCRTCCQSFERGVDGGVAVDGAGVVDEDVDAAEATVDLVKRFGAFGGREVGLEGGSLRADGLGGLGGGAAIAVQGDFSAGLGERSGERGANAAEPVTSATLPSRRKESRMLGAFGMVMPEYRLRCSGAT